MRSNEKSRNASPLASSRSSARRRVLSTGAAAGVTSLFLPGQWIRPVVESVLLPAHALTSHHVSAPCFSDSISFALECPGSEVYVSVTFPGNRAGLCVPFSVLSFSGPCTAPSGDNVCLNMLDRSGSLHFQFNTILGATLPAPVAFPCDPCSPPSPTTFAVPLPTSGNTLQVTASGTCSPSRSLTLSFKVIK